MAADIHVLPFNDLVQHLELRQCWCHPRVEEYFDDRAVIVHHSADGREYFEAEGEVSDGRVQ